MEDIAVIDPSAHHSGPNTLSTGCVNRDFSIKARNELKALFILAWPTILSFFLLNFLSMISLFFAGRIGKTELAAASLAISFLNVTGVSVGIGLLSALETLCSQAFGAKNYKLVGIVLQRGIWILSITCFPVWTLWINTEMLLLSLQQNAEIVRLTQDFVLTCIPALPGIYLFELLQRYLQSQGLVKPVLYVGIINIVFHIGICSLMVYALGLGLRGVAAAWTITYGLSGCFLGCYTLIFKLHKKTWPGWSISGLLDWGQFVRLAVPGMLMICIEWWSFEIGAFVMGYMGEVPLAAYGILMQWLAFIFMIPLGLSVAAGVRVGNKLGAGDPNGAKLSCIVSLLAIVCIMVVACVLVLTCRTYMGRVYSGNKEVVLLVADVALFMGPFELCDGLQGVCSGVIRGCGRQKIGVVINFISYIVIQLPLGILFSFYFIKELKGYYTGIVAGLSVQALSYLTVLWRTDWTKEANLAKKRALANPNAAETNVDDDERATFASVTHPWIERVASLLAVKLSSVRSTEAGHASREDRVFLIGQDTLTEADPEEGQQNCSDDGRVARRHDPALLIGQHAPTETDPEGGQQNCSDDDPAVVRRHDPALLISEHAPTETDPEEGQQNCSDDYFVVRMSGAERLALVLRRLLPLLVAIVVLGAGACVRLLVPLPS